MKNVPSNDFNFCPKCGSKSVVQVDGIKWKCPDCDFTLYNNVAAAVGLILYDREGNVLFEVRQKDPGKGQLSLVGGFIDGDETAENAVVRECKEEIGFTLGDGKTEIEPVFLCTQPNTYPYKNIVYKTCDVYFTAKIPDSCVNMEDFIKSLKPQKGEVVSFVCQKVCSQEDIGTLPIAFESAKQALKVFVSKKNKKELS